jgi:hypothetical protein
VYQYENISISSIILFGCVAVKMLKVWIHLRSMLQHYKTQYPKSRALAPKYITGQTVCENGSNDNENILLLKKYFYTDKKLYICTVQDMP